MHRDTDSKKDTSHTETHKIESGWQAWQGIYNIKRNKAFRRIVDVLKKHLPISG
jgi:hypothetical protein